MNTIQPIVGNLASLTEGQVLLPAFVKARDDGLFVELASIDSNELFLLFAENVFKAGACFQGLDYGLFLKLAFELSPTEIGNMAEDLYIQGKPMEVRLADAIVPFPLERRRYYRALKVSRDGAVAEYLFEPLVDDISGQPVKLQFDEYVAHLWEKGVRFGIDESAVRNAIAKSYVGALAVARLKPVEQGKDASVEERTDALYRNDAPAIRPDGRVDLRQFHNRFPQVKEGTRLFQKIPRQFGRPGFTVGGTPLLPDEPKDFQIETLAGPGTRVFRDDSGEYVVAAMTGFLNIDNASGQISITEKIINREGVSLRTTGDLVLDGDEFEEHGEVQEQRNVEGRNMTFHAPVFGNVLSRGGRVLFKNNLAGGTATILGEGAVEVRGHASRATLVAREGEVRLATADSCLIVARKVVLKKAVNCDICAEELEVEEAEGCGLCAISLTLKYARARKGIETQVTIRLPDLTPYRRILAEVARAREQDGQTMQKKQAERVAILESKEVKGYLAIRKRVEEGNIKFSSAQQTEWDKLELRLSPLLAKAKQIEGELRQLQMAVEAAGVQQGQVRDEMTAACAKTHCRIASVNGDVVVRAVQTEEGGASLPDLPPKELRALLRSHAPIGQTLFAGISGGFEWQYALPVEPEETPAPGEAGSLQSL